jgi:phage shock protein E
MTGCANDATPAPTASEEGATLRDRDSALAHRLVEEEHALLLDVRTSLEFSMGHLDGAVNIPHDQIPKRLAEISEHTGGDHSRAIVLYCRSGRRADTAKAKLVKEGYTRVTNLGGMSDW